MPHSGPFSPFSHLYKIVWDSWCLCRDVSAGPRNSKYGGDRRFPHHYCFCSQWDRTLTSHSITLSDEVLGGEDEVHYSLRAWCVHYSDVLRFPFSYLLYHSLVLLFLTTLRCQKYTHTDLKCLKRCHQGLREEEEFTTRVFWVNIAE